MSIDLNPSAANRLIAVITEALSAVVVTNNKFLDYASLEGLSKADAVVPDPASNKGRQLAVLIGSEPVSDFVSGRLSDMLTRRDYVSDVSQPLTSIEGFSDSAALAHRLVTELSSLPWKYDVLAQLPWEFGRMIAPALPPEGLALSDDLSLATGEFLRADHITPPDHPRPALLSDGPTQLADDAVYLRVRVVRFIPDYGSTSPIEEAQWLVRAFFGMCTAFRLVRFGAYYSFGLQKRSLFVFRQEGVSWHRQIDQDIPPDAAQALAGLGHNKNFAALDDLPRTIIVRQQLAEFRRALAHVDQSRPLLLAAQWLFDSWSSSNRLLGYVQAMVALESLLGDKATSDVVGLGDLLANRTAYLVAETRTQRDEILADFRRIYETRSKIVHRGKNRLTARESKDFGALEWLCARVIQEETKLLAGPASPPASR